MLISTTARATDNRHLELRQPLGSVPASDVRVFIIVEATETTPPSARAADFLAWAARPRPRVGLRDAGRDAIYED